MQVKSKRILVLTTAFKPLVGGSEMALDQITERLPDIFFDIITPKYFCHLPDIETDRNRRIFRIGCGSWLDKPFFIFAGLIASLRLLRKYNYEAIHAYQASYGGIVGALLKIILPKMRFILTLQEGENLSRQCDPRKILRDWIIRTADSITAISNYLADYVRSIKPSISVVIIPNGVDTKIFHPRTVVEIDAKKPGMSSNSPVIVTVSRLVSKNGVGDLIEAIAELKERDISTKLLIIGDGQERHLLEERARELVLHNAVVFIGEVAYNEIPRYLIDANVFVRLSRSEGLGNAFLEAMACGIPVVGTAVGGIPDIIKNEETGLLCEARNPRSAADAISRLLSDKDLARHISKRALAMVHENYDWQNIADRFGELIYK